MNEIFIKAKIKNVVRYKKPAFRISIVSAIAVLSVIVALACNQERRKFFPRRMHWTNCKTVSNMRTAN